MSKYVCELSLNVKTEHLQKLLRKCVDLLDFKPFEVEVYFNEFKNLKSVLFYDLEPILAKLSKSEMDGGITGLSFYDDACQPTESTPFFRININDNTFQNGAETVCSNGLPIMT